MPLVRYIGRKAVKTDNVAGTSTVWVGTGDVQPVSADAWAKLSVYDTVWELAESEPAAGKTLASATIVPPGPVTGSTVGVPDLGAMDRDALVALAKERGVKHHHTLGAEKLRALLA